MEEYLGYREVCLSDEDMAAFYSGQLEDNFGCLTNEYLLLKNTNDELCDQVRWTGEQFAKVPFKQINSRFFGKVKPRNIQQQLALDMLYNQDITVKFLAGKFGTGKDIPAIDIDIQSTA